MKIMKILMERVDDELQDAYDYATLALEYKATEPETAKIFAHLSEEEMTHAKLLHECAVSHAEHVSARAGHTPEAMSAVYEYLHKRQIEKAETVKRYQCMYAK